jgi:deazaflavin-dependent oxidoreductase (nitroreductase family)
VRHARGALLGALLALGSAAADPPPAKTPPDAVGATLAGLREQRTVELTTVGRRTGKPHTVPVWFVVDGDTLYLNTLDPTRDWVLNAKKTPAVRLDFGSIVLAGELATVADPALEARVRQWLRDKYWMAWVGGLAGQVPKETYAVTALHPVPR